MAENADRDVMLAFGDLRAEQLWRLLEESADGVWYWDSGSGDVLWSACLQRTLGMDAEPRLGLDAIFERTHEADRERHARAIEDARETLGTYRVEVRMRHERGHFVPLVARGIWLPPGPGAATGPVMIGYVTDQSELVEAQTALATSEARFRAFFDQCPAAVFIKDEDGRHVYGNGMAAEIAGVTLEEFLHRKAEELFPAEQASELRAADRAVLDSQQALVWSGDLEGSGRTRFVVDTKFPITDPATGERYVGGFGVDMTELREMRRRLDSAQRLESLGLLAGGVAHDFNNLLVGIQGNAELLREDATPQARELVDTILSSARHAADLCDRLLEAAGRRQARTERLAVGAVLDGTQDLLDIVVRGKGTLRRSNDAGEIAVECDPAQLQQALSNLVLNAVEAASPELADVTVSSARVPGLPEAVDGRLHDFLPEDARELVRIRVEDRGPGIAASSLDRLFEPFYTSKPEGTGLGLAAVFGAVRANRGAIRVANAAEGGAVFDLFLPARGRTEQTRPAVPASAVAPRRERILVVDDNETVARTVMRQLGRRGHEAAWSPSGDAALERIRGGDRDWDLVIVDMSMPGRSGLETLHALRADGFLAPVLIASGYQPDELPLEEDPACAFIGKPFSRERLYAAVDALLDGPPIRR